MPRLVDPFEQFFDSSGDPLVSGLVDFYESGSNSVRKTTYADSAETIANPNPVVLNGDGRAPNVFGSGSYRAVLRTATGTQIISRDPIGGATSLEFGADWNSVQTYSASDVVRDGGFYWISKTNSNIGNRPSTDGNISWVRIFLGADDILGLFSVGSYNDIRSLTVSALSDGQFIQVTDVGINGAFTLRNAVAHGLTDNGGTIIVIDADWYAERVYTGDIDCAWFGAAGDWDGSTGTDDTVAIQAAMDYAISVGKDLTNSGFSLISSLKYNRVVDGNAAIATVPGDAIVDADNNDYFFTIRRGGFATNTASVLFDTDLTNNDALLPIVQLMKFENVKFEASSSALAAYAISPKYLRTVFSGCEWRKIKCVNSPTQLMQSIYFVNGCQARRWTGTFYSSKNANFDLQVDNILMEAGGDGFDVDFPVGSNITSTIEGMQNFAIKYVGANAFNITCYHEGNGRSVVGGLSIDGSAAIGVDANEIVTVRGCYLSGDDTDFSKPQIKWGDSIQSLSIGNHCSTVMHEFTTNSRPTIIGDYARMALSTNDQKAITAITQANPAVVTIAGHGYVDGDAVSIVSVSGMTEVNDLSFTIANVTANTFELSGVDSTAYTAYTSGGLAYSANHSIRNQFYSGIDIKSKAQYGYGARLRGEFVGGLGGRVILRSINAGAETSRGVDIDEAGNIVIGTGSGPGTLNNLELSAYTPSNTSLVFIYKGSDGVSRTASLTLV